MTVLSSGVATPLVRRDDGMVERVYDEYIVICGICNIDKPNGEGQEAGWIEYSAETLRLCIAKALILAVYTTPERLHCLHKQTFCLVVKV